MNYICFWNCLIRWLWNYSRISFLCHFRGWSLFPLFSFVCREDSNNDAPLIFEVTHCVCVYDVGRCLFVMTRLWDDVHMTHACAQPCTERVHVGLAVSDSLQRSREVRACSDISPQESSGWVRRTLNHKVTNGELFLSSSRVLIDSEDGFKSLSSQWAQSVLRLRLLA